MNLLTTAVPLVLSLIACTSSQSHETPVAPATRIGSVYLVPVFVPSQQEEANVGEIGLENYRAPTPLQKIVFGYTPKGQQYGNPNFDQEIVNSRHKRSPGGGRGGGGGKGGGRGSSGSWSNSQASSSSGSWGSGSGGGRGGGGGKGHGK